jgi:ribosome-associated protein
LVTKKKSAGSVASKADKSTARKSTAARSRADKSRADGVGQAEKALKGADKLPRLPKAVSTAIQAAHDKKAVDVVLLDLRKADGFTDFFIICTGGNPRQITAIADAVRESLRELGERPTVSEGANRSEWVLLDYFNFVVHIFSRDCRSFYDLERLWGNAKRYEVSDDAA